MYSQAAVSAGLGCQRRVAVELRRRLQSFNFADPDISLTLDVLQREAHSAISVVKFLCTLACGPLGTEAGYQPTDFVEVDAITAQIGLTTGRIFNAASRNDLGNDVSDFADPEILVVATNIEDLVVNCFSWRIEYGDMRQRCRGCDHRDAKGCRRF